MTWRTLRHPHILEFLGTFKRGEYLYFVSPFINNGTLIEHVAGHPEVNRIKLLYQAADAVSYLHQHMIVHGDIKGSNILIGDNGHSLLCDFGLTKMTHSRTSTALRGAGTVRWQSPELWDDEPKSLSSDVYAFGMTIAEVLTDDVPFAHLKSNPSVILAVMGKNTRPFKAPLQSSTGISYQNAWEVAEACWSKQPEDRISMLVAFQRLLADPSLS
ncbi:hypothetical protein M407DRAFT_236181 [Tulasnella calospora MUT 4182]|uniref:Protein kinase domain-containing protein n=1 Tax=Tulasnella calospora MUT 4182 TaxID=1051891 RepID=A0A0C3QHD6_9AGAM|nr:hypothetical protein M407DRAFT_236181 [Tulasnella calospora MUT 4182]